MYVYHTPPTNVNIDKVLNGTLCLLDIYYDYGTRNFHIDPFDGNRSKLTRKQINEYNCDVTLSETML